MQLQYKYKTLGYVRDIYSLGGVAITKVTQKECYAIFMAMYVWQWQ